MQKQLVRLVLAISLDGRLAWPEGGKAELGSQEDRKVLEKALAWSEATLMGGITFRAHQSTCLINQAKLIHERKTKGYTSQPISIVVSSRSCYPKSWPFFHQPIERWLLQPYQTPMQQNSLSGFQQQFLMKGSWSETLSFLQEKGLSRLLILGGASLTSSLLMEDKIDELQLTLTPRIIGGKHSWLPLNVEKLPQTLSKDDAWELKENERIGSNEILLSYKRIRSS